MKFNTLNTNEVKDRLWGKVGTPDRDKMECQLQEEIDSYFIGKTISTLRQENELTQQEFGDMIGVKRSQVCKLEKGQCSPTLTTITRVFQALGVKSGALVLDDRTIKLW